MYIYLPILCVCACGKNTKRKGNYSASLDLYHTIHSLNRCINIYIYNVELGLIKPPN